MASKNPQLRNTGKDSGGKAVEQRTRMSKHEFTTHIMIPMMMMKRLLGSRDMTSRRKTRRGYWVLFEWIPNLRRWRWKGFDEVNAFDEDHEIDEDDGTDEDCEAGEAHCIYSMHI